MSTYSQPGFFDVGESEEKLAKMGDPLVKLNKVINWDIFRKDLMKIWEKKRKSNAGAKVQNEYQTATTCPHAILKST